MTLKELGTCTHVARLDRVIEFRKAGAVYHAVCPHCKCTMRWENWTKLYEPLRARCSSCGASLPSTELALEQWR